MDKSRGQDGLALPHRPARGHKGTFGTVCVLGGAMHLPSEDDPGAAQMIGGPALSALAALRCGAGLVRLAMPEPALASALAIAPEATGLALSVDESGALVGHLVAAAVDQIVNKVQCLAIGPGLGSGSGVNAAVMRAVGQESTPIVVDADGLNALCHAPDLNRDFRAAAVLTPHIGEFRRLAVARGIESDPEEQPERAAEALAQRLGCVVVLKSSATAVTDGHETWVHDHPNPALGTAGSGDVLTGIIASLVAQHFKVHLGVGERSITSEQQGGISLFDAARIGVSAHAWAAQAWVEKSGAKGGMLASDLLAELPGVIESLRAQAE